MLSDEKVQHLVDEIHAFCRDLAEVTEYLPIFVPPCWTRGKSLNSEPHSV